jgi:hypothetical protein
MPTLGNGDVVVGLGAVHGDVAPEAPAVPILAEADAEPDVVEVVPNGDDMVGPGTTVIGLIPRLLSSVEPSGIAALLGGDPAVIPEVEDVDDMLLPDVVEPQLPDIVEVPDPGIALVPPPSNTELEPIAVPELEFPMTVHVVPSGAGLKPPTSSSVAPN